MSTGTHPQTTQVGKQVISNGLTIIGTEAGCGKTVFMTGLAAMLRQQGVALGAVKPISFAISLTRVVLPAPRSPIKWIKACFLSAKISPISCTILLATIFIFCIFMSK